MAENSISLIGPDSTIYKSLELENVKTESPVPVKSDIFLLENGCDDETIHFHQRLERIPCVLSLSVNEANIVPQVDFRAKLENLMYIIRRQKQEITHLNERLKKQECIIKSNICKETTDAIKEFTEAIMLNHEDHIESLYEHYQWKLNFQQEQFKLYLSKILDKEGKYIEAERREIPENTRVSLQNEEVRFPLEVDEGKLQQEKSELQMEVSLLRSNIENYKTEILELTNQNENLKGSIKKLRLEKAAENSESEQSLQKEKTKKKKIHEKLVSIISVFEKNDSPAAMRNDYRSKLRSRPQDHSSHDENCSKDVINKKTVKKLTPIITTHRKSPKSKIKNEK